MPGKMARSATRQPFRLAQGDGSRQRRPPVLPKRRKRAKNLCWFESHPGNTGTIVVSRPLVCDPAAGETRWP
jgi:hypothetical protein